MVLGKRRHKTPNVPPSALAVVANMSLAADDSLADDLLDELNGLLADDDKPARAKHITPPAQSKTATHTPSSGSTLGTGTVDIDSLLADLDGSPSAPPSNALSSAAPSVPPSLSARSQSTASSIGSIGFPSADDDNATKCVAPPLAPGPTEEPVGTRH